MVRCSPGPSGCVCKIEGKSLGRGSSQRRGHLGRYPKSHAHTSMQYCGLALLVGCLATGNSSEPHTQKNHGLGKQFVKESERVYCLELCQHLASPHTWPAKGAWGQGCGGSSGWLSSSTIPSLARYSIGARADTQPEVKPW